MTVDLLLIGCPASWRERIGEAAARTSRSWPPASDPAIEPAVVVIGPEAERPVVLARSITRDLGRVAILLTSPPSEVESLRSMLAITPLVSPHTTVVPLPHPDEPPEELAAAIQHARRLALHARQMAAAEQQRIAASRSDARAAPSATESEAPDTARERLYALIAESTDDAVFSVTLDGRVTSWNPAAERLYGRSEAEMIGARFEPLVEASAREEHRQLMRRAAWGESSRGITTRHRTAAGRTLLIALTVSPIRARGERVVGVSAIARDIGREAELEARHSAIITSAFDAILTMDAAGRVVEFNPAAQAMFGYDEQDALGRPLAELIIPERFREGHRAGVQRLLAGGSSTVLGRRLEVSALRHDGTEFPVELVIARLEGTQSVLFTGFLRDLTELRRAQDELRHTIRTLERSNRDLEQFAYVASHDLQEPLRMVSSFMQLLQADYADQLDATAAEYIAFATDGATRMKKLIDGLLAYSRVDTRGQRPTPTDVQEVLDEAVAGLRLRMDAEQAVVEASDLPVVLADPGQLLQVFQNLVANALKFRGPAPPRINVSARPTGGFWEITVQDNGIGFEPEHAERIFSMFQRLHARGEYEGHGIGLSIAQRIVDRHGGRMWATSVPGQGSCFHLTLPCAEARPP